MTARTPAPGDLAAAANSADAPPLDGEGFACLMRPFDPFEPGPAIAVAVSGGADSLCLALLARDWARARGGSLLALVVDHALRPASAQEAALTAERLGKLEIPVERLLWNHAAATAPGNGGAGSKGGNLQAAARAARYRLLEDACRRSGILHLMTAHHLDDQAETLLLRLARGSGLEGLAGIPAVAWRRDLRILRPLLTVPKARLTATLRAAGLDWVEDPSNRSPDFARGRLRALSGLLAEEGADNRRLARSAAHLGRARASLEVQQAEILARALRLDRRGFAWLRAEVLAAAPEEAARRVLARLVTTLGGRAYPPRWERLEALYRALRTGSLHGRTLSGCRFLERRQGVLVVREVSGAPSLEVVGGAALLWDGRFRIELPAGLPSLRLAALGSRRWGEARGCFPGLEAAARGLPAPARDSLPALFDGSGALVALPALDLWNETFMGAGAVTQGLAAMTGCVFLPQRPLSEPNFTVA